MSKRAVSMLSFLALMFYAATALSVEQQRETENHIIYFNVLPTSALPEAMARAYGITRSETRVLLNVTVHRTSEDNPGPVRARIEAQAVNLTGQLKRFRLRELSEDDAIYYIGDIGISSGENLNFEIRVTPEGSDAEEVIQFRRAF
ncbi:DUF4426 domain-containing protein [Natronospira bacteriovora]|uniref:DUF4426 domain-containing protein n=1 Tax=Natronospira bacteriovora TaxID=3069753 RepID=A0ABU0W9A1_9GAMM|nr:DUF4426 domain-containing protein [Natronospira sp. AB-CW4]MDQ2070624.1 DUF4426 domain-containing protein [Natronospira sp. AB-CW4]